jgi:hypothetical protein
MSVTSYRFSIPVSKGTPFIVAPQGKSKDAKLPEYGNCACYRKNFAANPILF